MFSAAAERQLWRAARHCWLRSDHAARALQSEIVKWRRSATRRSPTSVGAVERVDATIAAWASLASRAARIHAHLRWRPPSRLRLRLRTRVVAVVVVDGLRKRLRSLFVRHAGDGERLKLREQRSMRGTRLASLDRRVAALRCGQPNDGRRLCRRAVKAVSWLCACLLAFD